MTFSPPPESPDGAPWLSRAPWAGFSPREHARDEELAVCPSRRCRRLKACVAAHDDLFCQRTHVSHEEWLAEQPRPKKRRLETQEDMELYRIEMEGLIEERQIAFEDLQERWKAGEFDHVYGKWRARGVLMKQPPKVYQEKGR